MILALNLWEALFNIARGIVQTVLGLLPTWNPLAGLSAGLDGLLAKLDPFLGLVGWANLYFPVKEALAMLGLLLTLHLAASTYNFVQWVLSWIRGGGGNVS